MTPPSRLRRGLLLASALTAALTAALSAALPTPGRAGPRQCADLHVIHQDGTLPRVLRGYFPEATAKERVNFEP